MPHKNIEVRRAYQREYARRWNGEHLERKRRNNREAARRARLRDPEGVREKNRQWKAAHPDKIKEYTQRHQPRAWELWIKRNYGLSVDDYQKLVEEQHEVCAICKTFTSTKKCPRLCVDHDHVTKKVRRLLCGTCNSAIGLMKESPVILRAAAAYLESFQTSEYR